MKRIVIGLIVSGMACCLHGQVATNEADTAVLRELVAIHAVLDRIAIDVASLKQARQQDAKSLESDSGGFVARKTSAEQLRQIHLAPNATAAAVKQYVHEICAASRGQNSFSDDDPQIRMLAKVGSTNVQHLIDCVEGQPFGSFHLEAAIALLADDQNKSLILKALPEHKGLVKVIARRGWESDAKETLLTELRESRGAYLPSEWITAVAALQDPASYALLRDYFIHGSNKAWTYNAIKDLPIPDLPKAVEEAWIRSRKDRSYEKPYMARIAMTYGHKDALEYMLSTLADGTGDHDGRDCESRSSVLKVIDFYGSDTELNDWFNKNREKITFDPSIKKFVIK